MCVHVHVLAQVGIEGIPVYYRGGHIVPRRERPRRSSAAQAADPYTLVVALDDKLEAGGDLYVDDGHSYAFQRGLYCHRCVRLLGMPGGRASIRP